ncbi:germination protein YpeB [Clostridium thermarum]|uniref:germination protein YpeB n=1 Tax=Clostridium thermarum TaxID=1716543 RepID=UPI00112321AA|nr:germination protein YpeB [Clostridium thermarum]
MEMTKKRMIYTLLVTLIVVFSTTYAILMTLERTDYRNYLQGEYSKNLYELINNLENIEDSLGKSAITNSKEQSMMIFEDIYRHATSANDRLNSLPIPIEVSQETTRFLSQVGDYGYTLVKATSDGRELTDEEYETISRLEDQSYKLKAQLNNILAEINQGDVKWGEIRKKVTGVLAIGEENEVSEKFKNVRKQVLDYPALIYDGPFSDNVLEIKPKVNELKEVSKEEAEKTVRKLFEKEKIESIKLRDREANTRISSYSFDVTLSGREKNESVVVEVSKHGGKIVYLLDNKGYDRPTIDEKKATEIANKYLESIGYKELKPSYTLTYEDNMIINYVRIMKDVTIYPEQIKLKVSLDDGTIKGIEAEKFLISHDPDRKQPEPKISKEEAQKAVSKRLQVKSIKLAIIPTEDNKEVLCYEFAGTNNDDEFLVYINAETRKTQRILKVINTPNGKLTL